MLLQHPFIVLEGVDGTGKSAACAKVAQRIGAIGVATPMGPYAKGKPKFNERTWIALESFRFYLEAVT